MKLRTQIGVVLVLFGIAPLLVALSINLPFVLDRLQIFYHKAYLQTLRADFSDLDQHLASRRETARLLAKVPEPGLVWEEQTGATRPQISLEEARTRYTGWINQILYDQPDIIQVLFVDLKGAPSYWLTRTEQSPALEPAPKLFDTPERKYLLRGLRLPPGGVFASPIIIRPTAGADDGQRSTRLMLRLVSPVYPPPSGEGGAGMRSPLGAAVLSIDIGGLARMYRDTYWVTSDGRYLHDSLRAGGADSAFDDFPGLDGLFQKRNLILWEGPDEEQVIWVPLFATEQGDPLWVGRRVDVTPIHRVQQTIAFRVGVIVIALLVGVWLLARWMAGRLERFSNELIEGLRRVLEGGEAVRFQWGGPEELRQLARTLNRLAQAHAQNVQAMRDHAAELEESNRYKTEFLANISHELRTPLNSILLLSKLLAEDHEGRLSPEQRRQAQVIHEAGTDLMRMIDNVLDLARIEARRYGFHVEAVSLPALLADLEDLFEPQFQDKGLYLRVEVAPEAPERIRTDADKLAQILRNFLANAVKFTLHGGVTVRLRRNPGPDGQGLPVRIEVQDTGIGIPPDKQRFIFEAFEQVDGSTSRRFGGTGLGLTISRELARLLGGRIELDSEEGRGSTFALLLPMEIPDTSAGERGSGRERETPVEAEPPPSSRVFGTGRPRRYEGRQLLVIEPDLDRLLALAPRLEALGFALTAVGDLQEAAESLDGSEVFDVAVADIMHLHEGPEQAIRQIRSLPGMETAVLLVLAEAPDAEARALWRQAGADELLPPDPAKLEDRLTQVLDGH